MRTEVRSKSVLFSAPRPSRIDAALTALHANLPNMVMTLTGVAERGTVHVTGNSFADLVNQASSAKSLHYLLVQCESSGTAPTDLVRIEFGSPRAIRRADSFRGWFRRIKEWDVAVTTQSGTAQQAESMLMATLSVLRGYKIATSRVMVVALLPAISEVLGLASFIGLTVLGVSSNDRGWGLSLIAIFYWRFAFMLAPRKATIHLGARPALRGWLLGWAPSARAQAIWTVVSSVAGLVALVVSVFAWLSPRG